MVGQFYHIKYYLDVYFLACHQCWNITNATHVESIEMPEYKTG